MLARRIAAVFPIAGTCLAAVLTAAAPSQATATATANHQPAFVVAIANHQPALPGANLVSPLGIGQGDDVVTATTMHSAPHTNTYVVGTAEPGDGQAVADICTVSV